VLCRKKVVFYAALLVYGCLGGKSMSPETINLLIGCGTGVVASFLSGALLKLSDIKISKIGSVKTIVRVTSFDSRQGTISVDATFENYKRDVAFIRDFCLFVLKDGTIERLIQANAVGSQEQHGNEIAKEEKTLFGESGFYSFAIPPREIRNYKTYFFTGGSPLSLCDLLVGYYDDRERLVLFHLPSKCHETVVLNKKMLYSKNYQGDIGNHYWD
jgi:hypothetical protein